LKVCQGYKNKTATEYDFHNKYKGAESNKATLFYLKETSRANDWSGTVGLQQNVLT